MPPYDSVLVRGSGPTYSDTPGAHPLMSEDVPTEGVKAPPKTPKQAPKRPPKR